MMTLEKSVLDSLKIIGPSAQAIFASETARIIKNILLHGGIYDQRKVNDLVQVHILHKKEKSLSSEESMTWYVTVKNIKVLSFCVYHRDIQDHWVNLLVIENLGITDRLSLDKQKTIDEDLVSKTIHPTLNQDVMVKFLKDVICAESVCEF